MGGGGNISPARNPREGVVQYLKKERNTSGEYSGILPF